MDTNFEKEVERVSGEFSNAPSLEQLEPEMQEQLRQVEALAAMDPSFANSTEYKDLMASMRQASVQADEEEEEEEEDEDDSDENTDIDDIFGIMATPKKGKEIKLNFEAPKEMIDLISSKFGVNDASKFFSSVDTWRNQAQEGSEVKKEYEALTADLQAMPVWQFNCGQMEKIILQHLCLHKDWTSQETIKVKIQRALSSTILESSMMNCCHL
jgi:hypothetical protein